MTGIGARGVRLLDAAHLLLVDARVVAAPRPSVRWRDLRAEIDARIARLAPTHDPARVVGSALTMTAMFLAVEASDVDGHIRLLGPDDPVREPLRELAAGVNAMADGLLARGTGVPVARPREIRPNTS